MSTGIVCGGLLVLCVSCTEYKEIPASGAEYPNARFNFGGYSYCLEQAAEAEGGAFLNFNLDSD